MVWEAVSSGKPVVVIEPWKNGKIKAKYNAFLSRLQDEKRIWKAPADAVDRVIQTQLERNGAGQFAFVSKEAEILNQAVREVLA
jgi:mitochondrial fission protein ELM1